jgi:hypothetical protein
MGAIPWGQVGPGALVAFFVVLVFTGQLVPRRYLKDSERREQEWRSIALESQKQSGELIQVNRDLTVTGETGTAMIRAITELANERHNAVEPKDLTT